VRNEYKIFSGKPQRENRSEDRGVYGKIIRGPFEKFVYWRQCAAVTQREAVNYAKL
jgi:hypothetical protein